MNATALAFLATTLMLGADAPTEVEKAISALNEAFQKQDAAAVKRLMADDHVAVTAYYGGPRTGAEQLAALADLKLAEYSTGKRKTAPLGKDAVLITYELTQKGTFKGKEVPRRNFVSAVWVKRDGRWLEVFYQETPLVGE
jgi:uncharacterized protein (TIGR02246 family)